MLCTVLFKGVKFKMKKKLLFVILIALLICIVITEYQLAPIRIQYLMNKLSKNPHSARNTLYKIKVLLGKRSLPFFISALRDQRTWLRRDAAFMLGTMQGKNYSPFIFDALREAILHDSDSEVKENAVRAIGELKPDHNQAIPFLISLLSKEEVRASTIVALGKFGFRARAAIPSLVKLFKQGSLYSASALGNIVSEDKKIFTLLASSLESYNKEPFIGTLVDILERIMPPEQFIDKKSITIFDRILRKNKVHSFSKLKILKILERIGPKMETASKGIIASMKDKQGFARIKATQLLAGTKWGFSILENLIWSESIKDFDPNLIMYGLSLSPKRAKRIFKKALEHKKTKLRLAALHRFTLIYRDLDPLFKLIKNDKNTLVRITAIRYFCERKFSSPKIITFLKKVSHQCQSKVIKEIHRTIQCLKSLNN